MSNHVFVYIKRHVSDPELILSELEMYPEVNKILFKENFILNRSYAEQFYIEHKDREFYCKLVDSIWSDISELSRDEITSKMLTGAVIEINCDIDTFRENVIGSTICTEAKENTIRRRFGYSELSEDTNIIENVIHCSDSYNSYFKDVCIILESIQNFIVTFDKYIEKDILVDAKLEFNTNLDLFNTNLDLFHTTLRG